jgi:hypothetical protein
MAPKISEAPTDKPVVVLPKRDPMALSLRIWGGIIMLFIALGGALGYDASDPDLPSFLNGNFEAVLAGIAGAAAIVSKVVEITRHKKAAAQAQASGETPNA